MTPFQWASPRLTRKPAQDRGGTRRCRDRALWAALAPAKAGIGLCGARRANLKTPKTLSRLDRFFLRNRSGWPGSSPISRDPEQFRRRPRQTAGSAPSRHRASGESGIGTIRHPMPALFSHHIRAQTRKASTRPLAFRGFVRQTRCSNNHAGHSFRGLFASIRRNGAYSTADFRSKMPKAKKIEAIYSGVDDKY